MGAMFLGKHTCSSVLPNVLFLRARETHGVLVCTTILSTRARQWYDTLLLWQNQPVRMKRKARMMSMGNSIRWEYLSV